MRLIMSCFQKLFSHHLVRKRRLDHFTQIEVHNSLPDHSGHVASQSRACRRPPEVSRRSHSQLKKKSLSNCYLFISNSEDGAQSSLTLLDIPGDIQRGQKVFSSG